MNGRLDIAAVEDAATARACALVRSGIPIDEAVLRALAERSRLSGLGEDNVIQQAAALEPIKAVRETVSPWLWVLSILGFGMAVLNTRRIAKMYSDWRRGKEKTA